MARAACVMLMLLAAAPTAAQPWQRHTIDNTSRGADGIRIADVNRDNLMDLVTGWEQGGLVRIYINPGPARAKEPWPSITVGRVESPEDAVFADLDGDGMMDVVSSTEGDTRTVYIHWAPKDPRHYVDGSAWLTEPVPATVGRGQWMYARPMQIDGRHGRDLIVGSKGEGAMIGWLQAPPDGRDMDGWRLHRLYDAGWIMSLYDLDMDGDGDADILASDRKGPRSGVLWLENPGPVLAARGEPWREHRIGATGREVMFIEVTDIDRDGRFDILAPVKPADLLLLRRTNNTITPWQTVSIGIPQQEKMGTAKAVRAIDYDQDGRLDLIFSCEQAEGEKRGVIRLKHDISVNEPVWRPQDLSGADGTKFDLIQLLDLDGDGDVDVLTCEEAENLGVIWYENPTRNPPAVE